MEGTCWDLEGDTQLSSDRLLPRRNYRPVRIVLANPCLATAYPSCTLMRDGAPVYPLRHLAGLNRQSGHRVRTSGRVYADPVCSRVLDRRDPTNWNASSPGRLRVLPERRALNPTPRPAKAPQCQHIYLQSQWPVPVISDVQASESHNPRWICIRSYCSEAPRITDKVHSAPPK